MKILKNSTSTDIEITSIGLSVIALSSYTVNVEDYLLLASDDSITELTSLISSGDIVVNDGTSDLSSTDGLNYIKYPDFAGSSRFDNSTNSFTSTNVQDAIEEAASGGVTIEQLIEFEGYENTTTHSTTSNGWVQKSGYPYTTSTKSPGKYKIDHTAQLSQTKRESPLGYQIQWRTGTSGSWITLYEVKWGSGAENSSYYDIKSGISVIELSTETNFQIRFMFGYTVDGGTARMQKTNITLWKVDNNI